MVFDYCFNYTIRLNDSRTDHLGENGKVNFANKDCIITV